MNKPASCFKCTFLGDCSSEVDKCGIDKHKFEPYLAKAVTRDKNCPLDMSFDTLLQRFCADCAWAECPYPEEKCDEFAVLYFTMCNSMVEELEKLKVETHELAFDDDDGDYLGLIDNDEVMDLIDNYIARLKGE